MFWLGFGPLFWRRRLTRCFWSGPTNCSKASLHFGHRDPGQRVWFLLLRKHGMTVMVVSSSFRFWASESSKFPSECIWFRLSMFVVCSMSEILILSRSRLPVMMRRASFIFTWIRCGSWCCGSSSRRRRNSAPYTGRQYRTAEFTIPSAIVIMSFWRREWRTRFSWPTFVTSGLHEPFGEGRKAWIAVWTQHTTATLLEKIVDTLEL